MADRGSDTMTDPERVAQIKVRVTKAVEDIINTPGLLSKVERAKLEDPDAIDVDLPMTDMREVKRIFCEEYKGKDATLRRIIDRVWKADDLPHTILGNVIHPLLLAKYRWEEGSRSAKKVLPAPVKTFFSQMYELMLPKGSKEVPYGKNIGQTLGLQLSR